MSDPKIVRFYFHDAFKNRAARGEHNFINRLCNVLHDAGFDTEFHSNSLTNQLHGMTAPGYSIVLMSEPLNANGLTIRLNYFYPFWQIETRAKRWEWPVSKAKFRPNNVPAQDAKTFARNWKQRLFKAPDAPVTRAGFVYAPLQGKLLIKRSFQSCSPLDMLEQLLEHDRHRRIVTTLHPKEDYSDKERQALEQLCAKHPRLSLEQANMEPLLRECDYVATQNSSVVLSGYFWHKPAVLFGQIDFHHIAANVLDMGAPEAIQAGPDLTPNYDAYLWWFLQKQSINAGRPIAEQQIKERLQRCGWPL